MSTELLGSLLVSKVPTAKGLHAMIKIDARSIGCLAFWLRRGTRTGSEEKEQQNLQRQD
jgi:hypothetical protein